MTDLILEKLDRSLSFFSITSYELEKTFKKFEKRVKWV